MTDTDIPPNLREAVEIMADAVQGMYVFTDNRECIEAECAAALRALLAQGWSVTPPQPVRTRPTIAELEAILAQPDGKYVVQINPDGSISAIEIPTIRSLKVLNEDVPSAPVGAADER